jgi:hypothetical protein
MHFLRARSLLADTPALREALGSDGVGGSGRLAAALSQEATSVEGFWRTAGENFVVTECKEQKQLITNVGLGLLRTAEDKLCCSMRNTTRDFRRADALARR